MDGILNINKPAGMTSHDVIAVIRRLSGQRKVGHSGTLDPAATGVLPVFLGQATRVIEFLDDEVKIYRAGVMLGATTDTGDAAGNITSRRNYETVTAENILAILPRFRGRILQTPPMYSALKHHGQPLYRLARAGISVEREPREVIIHRLEMLGYHPPLLRLEIECSRGTYIRSLATDIGEALGCGAYLEALERTRSGIFDISKAATLPDLAKAFTAGDIDKFLHPLDSVLQSIPRIELNEEEADAIATGQTITAVPGETGEKLRRRAYTSDGRLLAILTWRQEEGAWKPQKVFYPYRERQSS